MYRAHPGLMAIGAGLLACARPSAAPVQGALEASAGSGDRSVAAGSGDRSEAAGSGDRSEAAGSGDRSEGEARVEAGAASGAGDAGRVAVASDIPGAPAPMACEAAPVGMACVPAGPFVRGSDDGPENTRPAARVWLQTFYMDVNEVTYAEYKACVKARRCDPSGPGYTDFDRPRQPINGIRWFDADKYCEAQGKRLPSEAQWEKAARGPEGALYPWGDEPATCERAIIKDASGRSCGVKKLYSKPDTGRPWEVGSRPAYRYGLHDMADTGVRPTEGDVKQMDRFFTQGQPFRDYKAASRQPEYAEHCATVELSIPENDWQRTLLESARRGEHIVRFDGERTAIAQARSVV